MDTDDLAPPPKKAKRYELGQDLSKLSVAELRALIDDLKTEIARVEQTLRHQAIVEERGGIRLQTLTLATGYHSFR